MYFVTCDLDAVSVNHQSPSVLKPRPQLQPRLLPIDQLIELEVKGHHNAAPAEIKTYVQSSHIYVHQQIPY